MKVIIDSEHWYKGLQKIYEESVKLLRLMKSNLEINRFCTQISLNSAFFYFVNGPIEAFLHFVISPFNQLTFFNFKSLININAKISNAFLTH